eukprot:29746-Prymnesium_polylepis.1
MGHSLQQSRDSVHVTITEPSRFVHKSNQTGTGWGGQRCTGVITAKLLVSVTLHCVYDTADLTGGGGRTRRELSKYMKLTSVLRPWMPFAYSYTPHASPAAGTAPCSSGRRPGSSRIGRLR